MQKVDVSLSVITVKDMKTRKCFAKLLRFVSSWSIKTLKPMLFKESRKIEWKKINENNLPSEEVLVKDKQGEMMFGLLEMTERGVICKCGDDIEFEESTHYILSTQLLELPEE